MKLQALIEIISEAAKKPFDYPTQQKVKELIFSARAALIRQQYEKTGTFPTSAVVSACIDLEQKNSLECCGIDLGCKVTISVDTIPVPIDVKDSVNFLYVGTIDGFTPFGYLKPVEIPFIKYRRLSSKLKYYTWLNRKLIFFNYPAGEKARIVFVPSNPEDASKLNKCVSGGSGNGDTVPCIDLEEEAIIEDHWEDAIVKFVLPKIVQADVQQISVDEKLNG